MVTASTTGASNAAPACSYRLQRVARNLPELPSTCSCSSGQADPQQDTRLPGPALGPESLQMALKTRSAPRPSGLLGRGPAPAREFLAGLLPWMDVHMWVTCSNKSQRCCRPHGAESSMSRHLPASSLAFLEMPVLWVGREGLLFSPEVGKTFLRSLWLMAVLGKPGSGMVMCLLLCSLPGAKLT